MLESDAKHKFSLSHTHTHAHTHTHSLEMAMSNWLLTWSGADWPMQVLFDLTMCIVWLSQLLPERARCWLTYAGVAWPTHVGHVVWPNTLLLSLVRCWLTCAGVVGFHVKVSLVAGADKGSLRVGAHLLTVIVCHCGTLINVWKKKPVTFQHNQSYSGSLSLLTTSHLHLPPL